MLRAEIRKNEYPEAIANELINKGYIAYLDEKINYYNLSTDAPRQQLNMAIDKVKNDNL